MKRTGKKIGCLLLSLALLLTLLPVSVLAVETTRVYCQAPEDWEECYVYWWGSNISCGGWPGVAMTKNANGLWSYDIPSDLVGMGDGTGISDYGLLFTNNKGEQTGDLVVPDGADPTFVVVNNEWHTRNWLVMTTVYCQAPDSWETCYAYWWGSLMSCDSWPGVEMTRNADGLWSCDILSDLVGRGDGTDTSACGLIFTNNAGEQTGNLVVPTGDNRIFVVRNSEWVSDIDEEQYFVTGEDALCGSLWVVNDPNNRMTKDANGIWTKVYENVAPGSYELKVTDGTWENSWGDDEGDNYDFVVEATADVIVRFDSMNEIVTVEIDCDTVEPDVTLPSDHDASVITLFARVPDDWSKVYAYTWDDNFNAQSGDWPGAVMTKDGEWYKLVINDQVENVIISNGYKQSWDLPVDSGKDLCIIFSEDLSETIYYLDDNIMDDDAESVYRVVGNADWMGNWDPASDAGRMEEVSPGIYKQKFENVQPGNYELKIIRDGMWEHSWGDNGMNFRFTIGKTCDITVTFTLSGENGTISVKGSGIGVPGDLPDDPAEILEQAYALEEGESMPYDVTLTGRISAINAPYDEQFRNITVTIKVPGHNDKPIVCYRLKGEGADRLDIGMTITVSGRLCNYYGSIEFNAGCTLVSDDCKHNYKLTAIPASCTKGSYEAQVCTLCGDMDPDSISKETSAPLGHSYETQVVSPTCTKEGYAVHTCVVCGDSYTGGTTPARGHQLSDYISDNNATCTGDGTKTATCRRCGLSKTLVDEGSALGHSFTHYRYDYNALCQQDGTETAKCDRCAETDTRTFSGSALGHQYTGGYCERCGKEEAQRLPGDMTSDNNLNIIDVAKLYALIRSSDLVVDEELLAYADLTGDGKLNVIDVAKLYAQIKTSGR